MIEEVALRSRLSVEAMWAIASIAPQRYKVYEIPKKSGGTRLIAHPARELKIIQRATVSVLLSKFPVHEAAAAYRTGRGIRENAEIHASGNPILKLDFRSFFNSITAHAWINFINSQNIIDLTPAEVDFFTRILFWKAGLHLPMMLSVGAPSSPMLSNIIMFDFDTTIFEYATHNRIRYSRYADDITASSHSTETLIQLEKFIRQYISNNKTPELTVNEDKRAIYSRGRRRMVTGLVITPDKRISIGRSRKREISSLVHRYTLRQLDKERESYLKGMLSFALDNEKDFIIRLNEKYGNKVISEILSLRMTPRSLR